MEVKCFCVIGNLFSQWQLFTIARKRKGAKYTRGCEFFDVSKSILASWTFWGSGVIAVVSVCAKRILIGIYNFFFYDSIHIVMENFCSFHDSLACRQTSAISSLV